MTSAIITLDKSRIFFNSEFNIDFEVHKGKVIKNNEIKFDDYVWECTNPEIGG